MNTIGTVNKWGQSLGVRIPKKLIKKIHIQEGEKVEMSFHEGGIMIKPVMTLDWLMEDIVAENRHALLLDDEFVGKEQWEK